MRPLLWQFSNVVKFVGKSVGKTDSYVKYRNKSECEAYCTNSFVFQKVVSNLLLSQYEKRQEILCCDRAYKQSRVRKAIIDLFVHNIDN